MWRVVFSGLFREGGGGRDRAKDFSRCSRDRCTGLRAGGVMGRLGLSSTTRTGGCMISLYGRVVRTSGSVRSDGSRCRLIAGCLASVRVLRSLASTRHGPVLRYTARITGLRGREASFLGAGHQLASARFTRVRRRRRGLPKIVHQLGTGRTSLSTVGEGVTCLRKGGLR